MRYVEDESVLDKEHAGYVPVDMGDVLEGRAPAEEDGAEDEAEDDRTYRLGRVDLPPVAIDDEDDGDQEIIDPRVFPLQAHGCVDLDGEGISDAALFHNAAVNLLSAPQQRDSAVRPGNQYVNEYPRTEGKRRTDGGAANPNHMLGTFPFLFPCGVGGLEVDREDTVTYEAHIRWALQYDDGRFRKDLHFVFQGFGVVLKRNVGQAAVLQIKRATYIANEQAFLRLSAADFVAAAKEESAKRQISNPVIRSLRKQITTVRARVMGTDESRISIRAQVWGMIVRFNPPTIWTTINLADTGDPVAQVLAGAEIDLDHFIATAGPDSETRSRTIAA
ncbi:ATP-dependent DNA helicase [Mycena chlorophos]|uniref:ATP-dependent DNA helicase n=1 Tax=Mycena chlorophos TaxID=658473 RepID=A0A8H6TI93_MYCCL|nr:ATP-dependent DNA helicase [Mycena chlorophos]